MVKKLKQMADKKAGASGLFDSALANSVKESAQQIWLAGMGAFAKAQQEGGKVFEALVKDGASLQRKTQSVAEEKFGEVTSRMSNMAGDVSAKAGQQWDKLESIFEERVSKSMGKLGVPSAKDVAALSKRIDALSAQVAQLSKAAGKPVKAEAAAKPVKTAKSASAPAKSPAKKAGVKRTTTNGATKPAAKRAAARGAGEASSASA